MNLQPPVLETGALPIELRPWAASRIVSAAFRHHLSVSTMEDDDRPDDDEELLEAQEHKGYGDDEGEREEAADEEE